jgi:membrane protein
MTIKGIEMKAFFKRLYEKALFEEDVLSTAAQVAFYFTFALFPLLLFLFSLLGIILVSADEFRTELFVYMRQIMPASAYDLVRTTIEEVTVNSSGGKLTLGILIALWSASAGVDSLRIALNSVYNLEEKRSWIKTKLVALVLTLVLTILIMTALAIVFYGWRLLSLLLDAISLPIPSPFFLMVLQFITVLILLLVIFWLIYNYLPSHKEYKWVWITPGAVAGIILWLSLSYLFRLYLSYFNTYDKTYGSLGAVIILMLWLFLTALVIVLGGIINAVLQEMTDPETAAQAKEQSAAKLERAKADMPAHQIDEMIKEKTEEPNKSDDEKTEASVAPLMKAENKIENKIQPENKPNKKFSITESVPEETKTPNKTIIGLTIAGIFGFLMGAIFNKKDE